MTRLYPGGVRGRAALTGHEMIADLLKPLRFDRKTGILEWVANEGACKICQALDGVLVQIGTDVEEVAHPNCQCNLVPVDDDETGEVVGIRELLRIAKAA